MATAQEMKLLLLPVLKQFPEWRYWRGWLFRMPIGLYLRGIAFKCSWSDRTAYEIRRCVYPLFDFPHEAHIGWSNSLPVPGTNNHGWSIKNRRFCEDLIEVMESDIVRTVGDIRTGAEFLDYLTYFRTMHGWQETGRALAFTHMGELDKALEQLRITAAHFRLPHMQRLTEAGAWARNVLELIRLIEENSAAIPAHCEAVAQQAVQFNKLEKFWEPTPFVYDNASG